MKKYSYILKDLDCAHCAQKIETAIAKKNEFKNVSVNFNTLRLTLETDIKNNMGIVKEIIGKIEPEVEVLEEYGKREEKKNIFPIIRLVIGILFTIIGCYVQIPWNLNIFVTILAYAILLFRTAKNAVKLLIKNKTINENFLITISCIGAYLVGEQFEGLMVIILYEIGKILEEKAVNKTRKSVKDLMNLKPEYAILKTTGEKINPEDVQIGDIIVIKQGEKIPLDGIVVNGTAKLDTSALTGESNLKKVKKDDPVLSGSVNLEGLIEIEVTCEYKNSTVSKILELVENATDKKAKTETFVSKASKIYTPVVIGLAIMVAIFMPIVFRNITYSASIYKALIFLVISCPCAIAISVPLSYFSGIGKASKRGILIKGSDYLDELKNVKTIVFDKTGTLTNGSFKIAKINIFNEKYDEKTVLDLIAKGESLSNHPIAQSILNEIDYELDTSNIKEYKEHAGSGIEYNIEGNIIKIGNSKFVGYAEKEENRATVIYLKVGEQVVGNVEINDNIKEDAKNTIESLNNLGISTKMFTGDNEEIANHIANELNIKEYKANMLPTNKYEELEKMLDKESKNRVCFVGDGINDSPVIALSDIGISMGGVGTDAAIEASDIVIMTDDLSKIPEAIGISKKTGRIIKQNLIFAITTKILILIFSTIGIAEMWEAIFADVGVTLITILNTLRILR